MTHADGADTGEPAEDDPASVTEVAETDDETAEADEASGAPAGQEPDWVRRRRLDAAFGDGAHSQSLGDRWYRDQVPPHHG